MAEWEIEGARQRARRQRPASLMASRHRSVSEVAPPSGRGRADPRHRFAPARTHVIPDGARACRAISQGVPGISAHASMLSLPQVDPFSGSWMDSAGIVDTRVVPTQEKKREPSWIFENRHVSPGADWPIKVAPFHSRQLDIGSGLLPSLPRALAAPRFGPSSHEKRPGFRHCRNEPGLRAVTRTRAEPGFVAPGSLLALVLLPVVLLRFALGPRPLALYPWLLARGPRARQELPPC